MDMDNDDEIDSLVACIEMLLDGGKLSLRERAVAALAMEEYEERLRIAKAYKTNSWTMAQLDRALNESFAKYAKQRAALEVTN
jgi:hypothetical protein